MRRYPLILAAMCAAGSVRAQIGVGTGVTPETFGVGAEERKKEALPPVDPVALAASLAFDATTWTQLQVSTTAPQEMTRLLRKGYYRLELVQMTMLAKESSATFKAIEADREKGVKFRDIAAKRGVDYEALYERALAEDRRVEERYLPAVLSIRISTSPAAGKRPKPDTGPR
ncbi:MAG: hypothetical protein HY078_15845 [Elusimicrobia bacterium]|nr:hypothetical protein [Elusimicrobiota bacterium]